MAKIIGVSEICRRMLLSEATVMGLIQSGVLRAARNRENVWETTDKDLAAARGVMLARTGRRPKAVARKAAGKK